MDRRTKELCNHTFYKQSGKRTKEWTGGGWHKTVTGGVYIGQRWHNDFSEAFDLKKTAEPGQAMDIGELKGLESEGLPLVNLTDSKCSNSMDSTDSTTDSPGAAADVAASVHPHGLSQPSEALAKSMWRPLRSTTSDSISVVSFNMLLKGAL